MKGHDPYTDKFLGNVQPLSGTIFQHGLVGAGTEWDELLAQTVELENVLA